MAKQRSPPNLTNRDIELFELIAMTGFYSAQLLVDYGAFKTLRTAQRRIKLLAEAGYFGVRPNTFSGCKENLYFPILEKISSVIDKDLLPKLEKVCFFQPWKKPFTLHERRLRHWSLVFHRALPEAEITLDFMLYNNRHLGESVPINIRRQLPDMVVHLTENQITNIEIELTVKSDSRYSERLYRLITESRSNTIYLTDLPSIKNKITEITNETHKKALMMGKKILSNIQVFLFSELNSQDRIREALGASCASRSDANLYAGRTAVRQIELDESERVVSF